MSEVISIANLLLGIIGTITGSMAMLIHLWRLRRESPRLKVEVIDCVHDFVSSKSGIQSLTFWTKILIRNLGDRGTRIDDMEIIFESNGEECRLRKKYFRGPKEDSIRRWINAHDIMEVEADFYEVFKGTQNDQINCILRTYHTHGTIDAEITSSRRKREEGS